MFGRDHGVAVVRSAARTLFIISQRAIAKSRQFMDKYRTFGHEKEMMGDDGELVELNAVEPI